MAKESLWGESKFGWDGARDDCRREGYGAEKMLILRGGEEDLTRWLSDFLGGRRFF